MCELDASASSSVALVRIFYNILRRSVIPNVYDSMFSWIVDHIIYRDGARGLCMASFRVKSTCKVQLVQHWSFNLFKPNMAWIFWKETRQTHCRRADCNRLMMDPVSCLKAVSCCRDRAGRSSNEATDGFITRYWLKGTRESTGVHGRPNRI